MIGCSGQNDPAAPAENPPTLAAKPGSSGVGSERILYEVRLTPLGDESRSRGKVRIEIAGGDLTISVHANGVARSSHIPQHIHLFPTCAEGGPVLLNLDANLTVAGEGASVGPAFPMSNPGGVVNYQASRSLSDLLAAVNTHAGAGLGSVEELLDWLDLENRNAHMHVAVGPPFPAVNCGEVERR